MNSDFWRQMDFYPSNRNDNIIVVGAGSIGSYVTFGLARMGVKKITSVDYDIVEEHNLPNQFFSEHNMSDGILKITALQKTIELILEKSPVKFINSKIENILPDLLTTNPGAIVVTVDNMKTRKKIYDIIKYEKKTLYLIDGRVGGEMANVYSCLLSPYGGYPDQYYKNSLYDDSEVEELPCTGRSIIDLSFCISGQLINRTRHALMKKTPPIHTFHDYKIGQSWVMDYGHNKVDSIDEKKDAIKIGGSDGEI